MTKQRKQEVLFYAERGGRGEWVPAKVSEFILMLEGFLEMAGPENEDAVTIEIGDMGGCDGDAAEVTISYSRDETGEEVAQRKAEEAAQRAFEEAERRRMFDELKAIYGTADS